MSYNLPENEMIADAINTYEFRCGETGAAHTLTEWERVLLEDFAAHLLERQAAS